MNHNPKKIPGGGMLLLLIALVVVLAGIVVWNGPPRQPVPGAPETTAASTPTQIIMQTAGSIQSNPTEPQVSYPINLGYGLQITDSGKYTGVYMEDGSNEVLSDVMMVVVQNNGGQDIQLSELTALCGGGEYHFKLTNLAVGARAVLLDVDRKPSGGALTSAALENTVLFDEPMHLCTDSIQLSGMEGMMNVRNISDADIQGDIFIYYKYAAEDLFYGGITFRVRVEGGLKAGEICQIPAGHYSPETCTVVQVGIHG